MVMIAVTVFVCMLVSAMFMESSNMEKIDANHESILHLLGWLFSEKQEITDGPGCGEKGTLLYCW